MYQTYPASFTLEMQFTLGVLSYEICQTSSSLSDAITSSAQGSPGSLQNVKALILICPSAIVQHCRSTFLLLGMARFLALIDNLLSFLFFMRKNPILPWICELPPCIQQSCHTLLFLKLLTILPLELYFHSCLSPSRKDLSCR